MNKIYNELLEIKDLLKDSGQKIDSVSNSNVANNVENQIQTQINNYSKKTFKSLINYNKEIKIKKQYTTKQERKAIFWLLLIAAFIFPVLVIYFKGDKFVPDPFANCIYTYILFFILFCFLLSSVYYIHSLIRGSSKLIINDDHLLFNFGKKDTQIIYFKDIRSYIKESTSLGFSFFIYPLNDIYPIVSFYVENIHEVDAIDTLLTNRINDYIEKEKSIVTDKKEEQK